MLTVESQMEFKIKNCVIMLDVNYSKNRLWFVCISIDFLFIERD